MNSYSYDANADSVYKWDYAYNNWNFTSTIEGGGVYKPSLHPVGGHSVSHLMMILKPTGIKPSSVESTILICMLITAILSVIGIMAYKYKKFHNQKALNNSGFERHSEAVDNVIFA